MQTIFQISGVEIKLGGMNHLYKRGIFIAYNFLHPDIVKCPVYGISFCQIRILFPNDNRGDFLIFIIDDDGEVGGVSIVIDISSDDIAVVCAGWHKLRGIIYPE